MLMADLNNKENNKDIQSAAGDHFEIAWQAPEYAPYQKNVSWHWLVLILGIILIAVALWQKNFLFAVFIVIAEILLFYWGRSQPRLVEFKLNEKGLELDNKLHPYDEFVYFSVNENTGMDNFSQIAFKTKSHFKPLLEVYIDKNKIALAKEKLIKCLEEHEHEENLIDILLRLFRF